jgi:hypothetical protein
VQTESASPEASRARASIAVSQDRGARQRATRPTARNADPASHPRRVILPGRNVFCCEAETTDCGLDRRTTHAGPIITGSEPELTTRDARCSGSLYAARPSGERVSF